MRLSRKGKSRLLAIAALAVIFTLIVSAASILNPGKGKSSSGTAALGTAVVYADTVDYYQLKAGDSKVALFKTAEEAEAAIQQVKDKYVDQNAKNAVVTLSPELSVEKISVPAKEEQPQVDTNVGAIVDSITAGDVVTTTYTVQEGDTLWGIAEEKKVSVEEIEKSNPGMDLDYIVAGEEIVLSSKAGEESIVDVRVEYEETKEVSLSYETVYQEDEDLEAGEEVVQTEGKEGKAKITEKVVVLNGAVEERVEVSNREVVAPVKEVILVGTKETEETEEEESETEDESDSEDEYTEEEEDYDSEEEESETEDESDSEDEYAEEESNYDSEDEEEDYDSQDSQDSEESEEEETGEPTSADDNQVETFSESEEAPTVTSSGEGTAAGQAIVDYAMQFIGNPYVWGGTSLTKGCDCSGFVYSVFNDCGVPVSRFADNDGYPHVSASELQPGDVCVYGCHYAIYIGDGMEISAVNAAQGIKTHPMYYSNSPFLYGLRIVN